MKRRKHTGSPRRPKLNLGQRMTMQCGQTEDGQWYWLAYVEGESGTHGSGPFASEAEARKHFEETMLAGIAIKQGGAWNAAYDRPQ
jgi:hypothetical protein